MTCSMRASPPPFVAQKTNHGGLSPATLRCCGHSLIIPEDVPVGLQQARKNAPKIPSECVELPFYLESVCDRRLTRVSFAHLRDRSAAPTGSPINLPVIS